MGGPKIQWSLYHQSRTNMVLTPWRSSFMNYTSQYWCVILVIQCVVLTVGWSYFWDNLNFRAVLFLGWPYFWGGLIFRVVIQQSSILSVNFSVKCLTVNYWLTRDSGRFPPPCRPRQPAPSVTHWPTGRHLGRETQNSSLKSCKLHKAQLYSVLKISVCHNRGLVIQYVYNQRILVLKDLFKCLERKLLWGSMYVCLCFKLYMNNISLNVSIQLIGP